jgi:carbamoyltransferase
MFDLDNEHGAVHFSDSLHLIEKNITPENFQYYADKAKQVQVQTQEVVCNLIEKYVKLTGIKNVCLVGGYGLNVVANGFFI